MATGPGLLGCSWHYTANPQTERALGWPRAPQVRRQGCRQHGPQACLRSAGGPGVQVRTDTQMRAHTHKRTPPLPAGTPGHAAAHTDRHTLTDRGEQAHDGATGAHARTPRRTHGCRYTSTCTHRHTWLQGLWGRGVPQAGLWGRGRGRVILQVGVWGRNIPQVGVWGKGVSHTGLWVNGDTPGRSVGQGGIPPGGRVGQEKRGIPPGGHMGQWGCPWGRGCWGRDVVRRGRQSTAAPDPAIRAPHAASPLCHPKLPKVQAARTAVPARGSCCSLTHDRRRGKSPGFRGAGRHRHTLQDAFLWRANRLASIYQKQLSGASTPAVVLGASPSLLLLHPPPW